MRSTLEQNLMNGVSLFLYFGVDCAFLYKYKYLRTELSNYIKILMNLLKVMTSTLR